MREAAAKIVRFADGLTLPTFQADELRRDAILRNLEIIGEAAKHIPEHVRQNVLGVDWRKVIGFRDIVAHAYFGIDDVIVWDIVSAKIPELIAAMAKVPPASQQD